VADLKASSPKAAETRLRAALMHQFQHAELLKGGTVIVTAISEEEFSAAN
jgi:hypothetical protein